MKDKLTISAPVEGEYKNNPTLSIPTASGRPFTFGIEKAGAILTHLDAIQAFSAKHPSRSAVKEIGKAVATMSEAEKAELRALLAAVK